MSVKGLNVSRIQDSVARDNFARLSEALLNPFNSGGFKLVEVTITGNQTGFKVKHNLKFIPKDAILTSAIWSGTVGTISIIYKDVTAADLPVTIAGQGAADTVTLRLLVGRIEA